MNPKDGIKPYTKKELASLYDLSPRAFFTLLKPHLDVVGTKLGRYYSIKQVELIFTRLGTPSSLLEDKLDIS